MVTVNNALNPPHSTGTPEDPLEPIAPTDVFRFLLDRRVRHDPYPMYARLRETEPVHHSLMAVTLISRYDDVLAVLTDPSMSSTERNGDYRFRSGRTGRGLVAEFPARVIFAWEHRSYSRTTNGFADLAHKFLIALDQPDHGRLRSLASRAFTPKVAENARPMITEVADELLDGLEARGGEIDLLNDYAYRLPVTVVCNLLGVPTNDLDRFAVWVAGLVAGLDVSSLASPRARKLANTAALELRAYFTDLIAQRRADPGDDLLSNLIAATDDGDTLTEDELIAFVVLLLAAGHETTANLIGTGLLHLFANRDQLEVFRADSSVRKNAVSELLRYDAPVQLVQRFATRPTTIGGVELASGRAVTCLIGAANRDPRRFEHPDQLDLARASCQPLSFGFGAHHCLGAALARVEAEVGLGRLVDRYPDLALSEREPRWRASVIFRGLESLPARLMTST